MSTDDSDDELPPGSDDDTDAEGDVVDESPTERTREELRKTKERIGEGADKAVRGFDDNIVDLLSWLLDTETRARIYVYLRDNPDSTSDEVADGTGLYPSTVREALAELHTDEIVTREKRESEGAGNNPYEYEAIPPSQLVSDMLTTVQDQLNRVINLDSYLRDEEPTSESEPITISVDDPDEEDPGDEQEGDEDADPDERSDP